MSEKNKQGANRLARPQWYKVTCWVHQNYDRMGKLDRHESAKACSHDMGFPVSSETLLNVIADMGMKFPGLRSARSGKRGLNGRATREKSVALAKAVLALVGAFRRIMGEESLGGLAGGQHRKDVEALLAQVNLEAVERIAAGERPTKNEFVEPLPTPPKPV